MKRSITRFIGFLLSFLIVLSTNGQEGADFDVTYKVHRVYPTLSIESPELLQIKTIEDLNPRFPSDWIKEYRSVIIQTVENGISRQSNGADSKLTPSQLNQLRNADEASEINVTVQYLPENSLKNNEVKEIEFSVVVDPEADALFPGGEQELSSYLEQFVEKLSKSSFRQYHLSAITFSIDEEGHVINPEVYEPSKEDTTDEILKEAICNMPSWEPAQYDSGKRIKQDFVLLAGDQESCVRNFFVLRPVEQ